jgi:hypothetical protein
VKIQVNVYSNQRLPNFSNQSVEFGRVSGNIETNESQSISIRPRRFNIRQTEY